MRRLRRLLPGLVAPVAAVVALASCTGGAAGLGPTSPASTSPAPSAAVPAVRLVPLGSFSSPIWAGAAPGDAEHLYVAEKTGRVLMLDRRGRVQRTVLDLRPQLVLGGEQGLLAIAFDPGFARNRRMYAYFTDKDGDNRVQAYTVWNGVAIVPQDLLSLTRPYPNHNGGLLLFDPTGKLLLGTGDGGSAGDPEDRAQDPASPFGKILRLDPMTGQGVADNPYPTYPKVWATGLRNPWRFSFDSNGDLWLGDVGQSQQEELNVVPPDRQRGANYGWSVMEGTRVFKEDRVLAGRGPRISPVLTYEHATGGCSIVGGEVYRGRAVPGLVGSYVFGDFCLGRLWVVERTPDGVTPQRELGVRVEGLQGFGRDQQGELLVMSTDRLYRLTAEMGSPRASAVPSPGR